MTLIVGLKASDGVLLAADRCVTTAIGGNFTSKFPTTKLYRLGQHGVWGASGLFDVHQVVEEALEKAVTDNALRFTDKPHDFKLALTDIVYTAAAKVINRWKPIPHQPSMGPGCEYLFAVVLSGRPTIIQISDNYTPLELKKWPYTCIGSGDGTAKALLNWMRYDGTLNIEHARILAYRAVSTTGDSMPSTVGMGVNMATVAAFSGSTKVRFDEDAGVLRKEMEDLIILLQDVERKSLQSLLSPPSTSAPPSPPAGIVLPTATSSGVSGAMPAQRPA